MADAAFFAQMPKADAAGEITALCSRRKTLHGLNGSMLALDRLHMTLDHIGDFVDFPDDVFDAACAAADSLVVAPFSISLRNVVSFGRKAERLPLVLRESDVVNAGLASLQRALWGVLAQKGVPGPARTAFTPHVTLLYDQRSLAGQAVSPLQWVAGGCVLSRSFVGETRHQELGSWQLKT